MSNVISMGLPHRPNLAERQARLIRNFAAHRRHADDVFWLKENAEMLNVLASGAAVLDQDALAPYASFYEGVEERLKFFPQYYRFLLSLCLDLEDLGLGGETGVSLCRWTAQAGLAEAELSDLQRAEAHRLLRRRGCAPDDAGLTERLHRFMNRSETFVLPNKKAAYELTHIVFYLSDYGVVDPKLADPAITSLEFVGLLAYLDQDVDLLAEVCVALRFAQKQPSRIWEDWILAEMGGFVLRPTGDTPGDAYHQYLMTSWWAGLTDHRSFPGNSPEGGLHVAHHATRKGPLRAMSEYMFRMGPARSGDWERMREEVADAVGAESVDILCGAEQSTTRFGSFFEGFARA